MHWIFYSMILPRWVYLQQSGICSSFQSWLQVFNMLEYHFVCEYFISMTCFTRPVCSVFPCLTVLYTDYPGWHTKLPPVKLFYIIKGNIWCISLGFLGFICHSIITIHQCDKLHVSRTPSILFIKNDDITEIESA